jgi:CubicO group peptidase (beta-lactamase class C family)
MVTMTAVFRGWLVLLCVVLLLGALSMAAADPAGLVDVPRVTGVVVDGAAADWGDQGLQVSALRSLRGRSGLEPGYWPRYRVGWDERGLLLCFQVQDRDVQEATAQAELGTHDNIWLDGGIANEYDSYFRIHLTPGLSSQGGHPVIYPDDPTKERDREAVGAVQAASRPVEGGYDLEALLPWSALRVDLAQGGRAALRIYIGNRGRDGEQSVYSWQPVLDSTYIPMTCRFTDRPSAATDATVLYPIASDGVLRLNLEVQAAPHLAGRTLTVRSGQTILGSGRLESVGQSRASATISVPAPLTPPGYRSLDLVVDGRVVGSVVTDTATNATYPAGLRRANLRFEAFVFAGDQFPSCSFEQPELAEQLLGRYAISTVFYDRDYRVVSRPEKPGRYGAIVTVQPARGGRAVRRYFTLYRQPKPRDWWAAPMPATMQLPAEFGVDPSVAAAEQGDLADLIREALLWQHSSCDGALAVLLAGWSEMAPGASAAAPKWENASTRDWQWWLGLKRKLFAGQAPQVESFVAPRPIEGPPATVLHEGTLAEAGMKPDAVEKIDRVLQAWAADSDEGFAVLVARHGVIVLHRAYGMRDGRPMTVDTKSLMASITKTMSSNLMWMMLDQGLIDLDTPVSAYLPPLRGVPMAIPLTIRHLYSHSSGFPEMDHWGDEMNDLQEVAADYAPYLRVAERLYYNGVGLALGGEVMEMISGETVPLLYHRHLLGPLGCTNTEVMGTMGDARSVPLDMAKVAQLMLNGGAYGSQRFYSAATLARVLPQPLTQILGPETGGTRGLDVEFWTYPGLSKQAYGHGAASSADLIVDPVNDLVIVMTRNNAGRNFGKHHPQFIRTVAEAMQ